jgi:hypothetical protein
MWMPGLEVLPVFLNEPLHHHVDLTLHFLNNLVLVLELFLNG